MKEDTALARSLLSHAGCVDGDETRTLVSDNLQVYLSEANLPPGTRLSIGTAVLLVSNFPHRPCRSFIARFGELHTKRIARAFRTGKRGRGVLCTVLQAGRITVGDPIVVSRPVAATPAT